MSIKQKDSKVLGILHTEKGVLIVNPDNGFIIHERPFPKKEKPDLEKLKKQFPKK